MDIVISDFEHVVKTFTGTTATITTTETTLQIESDKSLYRLATILDGAVELFNTVTSSYRMVWKRRSKYSIELEVIRC